MAGRKQGGQGTADFGREENRSLGADAKTSLSERTMDSERWIAAFLGEVVSGNDQVQGIAWQRVPDNLGPEKEVKKNEKVKEERQRGHGV